MNLFLILIVLCSKFYSNLATIRPIIGVLSQETYTVDKYLPEKYDSYIAASYVKFLESAGARVIPVWIGQSKEYYARVVYQTNGVFFPGGGTYFNESGGYAEAAKQIFELGVTQNRNGVYYPIWGTCMGLQVLVFAEVGTDIRTNCLLKKISLPLDFTNDFRESRLFSKAPQDIINTLRTKNVTYNFHRYCLTEDTLEENKILRDWTILSTNADTYGLIFISSMEHKEYPIYGVQFHPEKNAFEFKSNVGISHCVSGIQAMQYFANFFVDECRKNNNSFIKYETELDSLIYNYIPIFTGKKKSSYEQIYVFKKTDFEKAQLV